MNSNKKVRTRFERIALGVGSASLCLAGLLIFLAIKKSKNFEKNGSKVEGVVTSSVYVKQPHTGDLNWRGDTKYKFHVEGKEYSGTANHYRPKGDRVLVSYLLSDPSENRVQDIEWYIESSVWICVSSLFGVAFFAVGYSKSASDLMTKLAFYSRR